MFLQKQFEKPIFAGVHPEEIGMAEHYVPYGYVVNYQLFGPGRLPM